MRFETRVAPEMSTESALFGGIEAGGTKFVCLVGTGPEHLEAEVRIDTKGPGETLARAADFFAPFAGRLAAVGIGSFGPVDLNRASPTWGFITSTPKPGWQQTDFAGFIRDALGLPVAFETDVNAAALGELTWGGARDVSDCLYITVGTGVGGGAIVGGRPLHGLVHPEMGHVRIPRAPGDAFPGACPYHGDCLEGMISGPALRARTGIAAEALPDDHPAWDAAVHYLSYGIVNFICTLSPERIIIGGGVTRRTHLLPRVRAAVRSLLNDYVQHPAVTAEIDAYLIPPKLGERSGALGAIALARALAVPVGPEGRI